MSGGARWAEESGGALLHVGSSLAEKSGGALLHGGEGLRVEGGGGRRSEVMSKYEEKARLAIIKNQTTDYNMYLCLYTSRLYYHMYTPKL